MKAKKGSKKIEVPYCTRFRLRTLSNQQWAVYKVLHWSKTKWIVQREEEGHEPFSFTYADLSPFHVLEILSK